ncbi:Putative uroporphyrinogen-III C-methyltransferase [Marinomonas spartinae]|uniref:uroporphyrinogen-III C-methyltransferase n=1 Tax=Marinomonas spartinae TaxID=1792290 RepID=UPI000808AB8A|nr:uroporphyrinogen-III C-methyltransferase [Marinomonas spartinae]SBS26796.1 Putative uroporphyrinogen-III C-methyltransferase [Marinomonas spartinae]
MTDNNNTNLEENSHPPKAPQEDTRSDAQKARDRKRDEQRSQEAKSTFSINQTLLSASIVISLASLSASGWLFYQAQQHNPADAIALLQQQQNKTNDQLVAYNQSRSQVNTLSSQVAQTEQQIKQQTEKLLGEQSQQSEQIKTIQKQLSRIHNNTKEDWKLAEVEYLVRLANQRVLLESDARGAIGLLSSADSILAELQDPMFFAARKAIAKDIQALKSTRHFDLQGRYLQLDALYDQVSKLPQREPSKAWQQDHQTSETKPQSQGMTDKVTGVLSEFWQSLKSLVIINYDHTPIKTLLPPTEYQQLVTGLQLQLDVAQVAMVKGESKIYQNALSRVAKAVTEHFDTKSQQVIAFLASITSLQQVNPAPNLPLPNDSLEAMKTLIKKWNERTQSTEQPQQLQQDSTPSVKSTTPVDSAPPANTSKQSAGAPETQNSQKSPNNQGAKA